MSSLYVLYDSHELNAGYSRRGEVALYLRKALNALIDWNADRVAHAQISRLPTYIARDMNI